MLALIALAVGVVPPLRAQAAPSPSSGILTAPATPSGHLSLTWHGTIGPGAHSAPNGNRLRCFGDPSGNFDDFHLQLAGTTASYYTTHNATLRVRLEWTPTINDNFNRLELTTLYDNGSGGKTIIMDGRPNNTNYQEVVYTNPPSATSPSFLSLEVCAAQNSANQDYTATATLTWQPATIDAATVTLTHNVNHDFAAVGPGATGGQYPPAPAIGFSPVDGPTQCPATLCDQYLVTVKYPSPRATYLLTNTTELNIHYTWSGSGQDLDIFAASPGGSIRGPGSPDTTTDPYEDLHILDPEDGIWAMRSVSGQTTAPTAASMVVTLTTLPRPHLPPEPSPAPGAPTFTNFMAPDTLPWNTQGSNEPSIGVNYKTGAVMYEDNLATARIVFDDSKTPAKATWTDVSPLTSLNSLDPIMFTDWLTGRTVVSHLTGNCSLSSLSDDDGASWTPAQGCGVPAGPDHQTVGGGPYVKGSLAEAAAQYPHALYYCSQAVAAAMCANSVTGAQTFNAQVPIYNLTQCDGLHGHVKVAPDGTAYVPNKNCGGGAKAAIVSEDGGVTWSIRKIPGTETSDGSAGLPTPELDTIIGHDPSIGIGRDDGTVYLGFIDPQGEATTDNPSATSTPKIAVSHDKGRTWSTPIDVGQSLGIKNADFAEVVGGDGGRAAFAFIGSRTAGNGYQTNFTGTWYLYVAFTSDGGKTWNTVDATYGDPVQHGCVWYAGDPTGTNPCRNMLDFNDIAIDTSGRILVAYTDGCVGACDTDPTQPKYSSVAALVRQNAVAGTSIIGGCSSFKAGCFRPGTVPNTTAAQGDSRPLAPVLLLALAGILAVLIGRLRKSQTV